MNKLNYRLKKDNSYHDNQYDYYELVGTDIRIALSKKISDEDVTRSIKYELVKHINIIEEVEDE